MRSSLLGHNGVEFFEVEGIMGFGSVQDISIVHKLSQFVIIEGFSEFSCDSLEAIEISITVSFVVPQLEDSVNTISGGVVTDSVDDNLKEFFEVDGSVDILKTIDDLKDDGASSLKSEFIKDLFDFDWVNSSSLILIEQVKGGLQLFVVGLTESVSH